MERLRLFGVMCDNVKQEVTIGSEQEESAVLLAYTVQTSTDHLSRMLPFADDLFHLMFGRGSLWRREVA